MYLGYGGVYLGYGGLYTYVEYLHGLLTVKLGVKKNDVCVCVCVCPLYDMQDCHCIAKAPLPLVWLVTADSQRYGTVG